MTLTVATVCERAGRPAATLTRRDVAVALLSVPPNQAHAAVSDLRQALLRAGNPLSPVFWGSAETIITDIEEGRASVGAVRRWLEATGTEPMQLIGGGFTWPETAERGPVGQEMYARLVEHLEALVDGGAIDPDRLATADGGNAWRAYEQAQLEWLMSPLPDGRTRMSAIDDEDTDAFLAAWDEAAADAAQILDDELATAGPRRCPTAELRTEGSRLRRLLPGGAWPYDLLRAAGGVDATELPEDDHELWLTLAAGVVTCQDEPPGADDDDTVAAHAAWVALDHVAWIGAVATLARAGPGTDADADSLARYAASYDGDDVAVGDAEGGWVDAADMWFEGLAEVDPMAFDDESQLQQGFQTVALLWRALGAIDADERLTPLGWWGVPEAALRAWRPDT